MSATQTPSPGAFGLARIGGVTGWWVALGQCLNGDGSRYTHAFLVLDQGQVLEAEPAGARIVPLANYLSRPDVVFSDRPALTEQQRARIVARARTCVGTKYSFLSYVSLLLALLHLRPPLLKRYIERSRRAICSALVDRIYEQEGVHLFDDGRICGDVTPGDLDRYRRTGHG